MGATFIREGICLTEEQLLQTYMAGDEAAMKIEIEHRMKVVEVSAVFQHEDTPSTKIELPGHLGRLGLAGDTNKSTWHLRGTVIADHEPGVYSLSIIRLVTAAGRTIDMQAIDYLTNRPPWDLRLRVVEEPTDTPRIGTVKLEPKGDRRFVG
jgi:hypothetical protein